MPQFNFIIKERCMPSLESVYEGIECLVVKGQREPNQCWIEPDLDNGWAIDEDMRENELLDL